MGSFTAQMLIGKPHPYHGGINPTHYLFLSENSRPAWILIPQNIFDTDGKNDRKITWIPTLDSMLEDAFLMIALYVLKHKTIVNMAKKYISNNQKDWAELYDDITIDDRFHMYEKCQNIKSDIRIILTVLEESSIKRHLKKIDNYHFDITVCTPQKIHKKEFKKK
jgi:hypothetical protein